MTRLSLTLCPRAVLTIAVTLCGLAPVSTSFAAQQSFSDVSPDHPAFAAVEFAKEKGIFKGYGDGTFKPGKIVLRAEAVKIIVATKLADEEVMTYTKRSFTDVPTDAWYRPYAEAAMQKLGIIDGPPKATVFNGEKTVTQAQFLKMLLKSQQIDAMGSYSEIQLALSNDVKDPTAWFYPYIRYAISASLIQVGGDGNLRPEAALTRGDVAQLVYRLAMYQAGKRTQALLSEEESELVNILQLLDKKDFTQAEFASARAVLASRGALQSKPGVAIVQAAVKMAEAFRSLVRAYKAGSDGNLQEVITIAKEAWNSAEKAKQLSASLNELSSRVQTVAKGMADQARQMLKQGAPAAPAK